MDNAAAFTGNTDGRKAAPHEALDPKWDGYSTFTVEEFAKIFRLSRAASYAAVANGDVKSIRIGRRVIIPRLVIERLLAA
jgi:excisionase family DNA binding protein